MNKSKFLGEFEFIVIAAVLRLGEEAYGVSILQEIEERIERTVTIGALYATLNRLEEKKYILGRMGEASPERGGRAKRYFNVSPLGQTQLKRSIAALNTMLSDLPTGTLGTINA